MKKMFLILGILFISAISVSAEILVEESQQLLSEIGALAAEDKNEEALIKCNQAIEKFPEISDFYFFRATVQSDLGKKDEAVLDCNKVLELKPDDEYAYLMRGIIKSQLSDNENALKDFNKVLDINPNNSAAYTMRACAKLELGDIDGADEDLEKAGNIIDEQLANEKSKVKGK